MTTVTYADTETVVKRWLITTTVAALVPRGAGFDIYLAMPKASPVPSLILQLVGGGPDADKDLPQQSELIQFDCWGTTREQASTLAGTLINELESLARIGGHIDTGGTYLGAAQVRMKRWLPDPESDTPRYIVDALITTVS